MSADVTHPPVTNWRQILGIVGAAVLTAVALVPLTLGFLAGVAFWALRWLWSAVVVGFQAGNADHLADRPADPSAGADA